mmetsp:Transcript_90221/g.255078  ORF Transcript_90221/g.255078 Transcript_90221/m.255078 type:complete len:770 (-) Transcript_90221:2977-5286(-)
MGLLRDRQELHGLDDVLQVAPSGVPHVAPLRRACREDHTVVLCAQLRQRDVLADLGVVLEHDALLREEVQAALDLPLLVQLHGGDAVHQQASPAVGPLDDLHHVARAVELLRSGEAGGPRTDDCDALAGAHLGRLWLDPAPGEAVLDDGQLGGLDRHRLLVDAKDAGLLAGSRAGGAGELREVVGVEQPLQRALPLALVHQLVPGGDAVAQRAPTAALVRAVARRGAAVHAPGRLGLHQVVPRLGSLGARGVDLFPIQRPVLVVAVGHGLAGVLVEPAPLLRLLRGAGPQLLKIGDAPGPQLLRRGRRRLRGLLGLRRLPFERSLELLREDLREPGGALGPVGEQGGGRRAARQPAVLGDQLLQGRVVLALHGLQVDALKVAVVLIGVQEERDASAHARAEIGAGAAEDHNHAPRHVLASVVADALHHRGAARVANGEPFSGNAREEHLSGGGAVQSCVARDDRLVALEWRRGRLVDDQRAAAQALADVVVRIPLELEGDPGRQEVAEGLAGWPFEDEVNRVVGQALRSEAADDVEAEDGSYGAVDVADPDAPGNNALLGLQCGCCFRHQLPVEHMGELVVLRSAAEHRVLASRREGLQRPRGPEEVAEVEGGRLPIVLEVRLRPEQVGAANELVECAATQRRHDFTGVLGHHEHEIYHVLGLTGELLAQFGVLRGDTDWASIEVALAHHNAAQGDQGGCGHRHLLCSKKSGHDHVPPSADLTVRLHRHTIAEAVEHQCLVGLREADFPWKPTMLDRAPLGRASSSRHP